MHKVLSTTIPGNHQAVLLPSRPLPLLSLSAHVGPILFQHITHGARWHYVQCVLNMQVLWNLPGKVRKSVTEAIHCLTPVCTPSVLRTCPAAMSFTVQPGLSMSPTKARQRGRAAKHGTQWHMLCGFLGTGWRTVALLCQASLYCVEPPLAAAHQATREAEKVFHWALIEKTPPWIQQMPVSCIDAQLQQSCWQQQWLMQGLCRGTELDHQSDCQVCTSSGGCRAAMQGRCTIGWGDTFATIKKQWKVTWKCTLSQTFVLFWRTLQTHYQVQIHGHQHTG